MVVAFLPPLPPLFSGAVELYKLSYFPSFIKLMEQTLFFSLVRRVTEDATKQLHRKACLQFNLLNLIDVVSHFDSILCELVQFRRANISVSVKCI